MMRKCWAQEFSAKKNLFELDGKKDAALLTGRKHHTENASAINKQSKRILGKVIAV
jgi:hypothetical protein